MTAPPAAASSGSPLPLSALLQPLADEGLQWHRPMPGDAPGIGRVVWLGGGPGELALAGPAALAWLAAQEPAARRHALRLLARQGLQGIICRPADGPRLSRWLDVAGGGPALASVDFPLPRLLLRLRDRLAWLGAAMTQVHGVLVDVHGLGLLVQGPAGIGKSELALELLGRGHRLVADDAVELRRLPGGLLVGTAPPLLRGFLEVRGLGVLDVAALFGRRALRRRQRVDGILRLLPEGNQPADHRHRLHGRRETVPLLQQPLPAICLPVRVGHNLATLAETAARDLALRLEGYRADERLAARQRDAIAAQAPADGP